MASAEPDDFGRGGVLGDAVQLRYATVARDLANEIRRRTLEPGDRLPSERELSRRLGTSRVTIRRALALLRQSGLVAPSGTRGWFLLETSLGEPDALMSFSEMATARGLTATAHVIQARTRGANVEEAAKLRVAPGTSLFELERVRLLDGIPIGVDHSRIVAERAPSASSHDFSRDSLYASLEAEGVTPTRSEYVLHAEVTDAPVAALLGVSEGAGLLVADAVTFDQRDRPFELSRTLFLGDRYRFQTTLFRRGLSSVCSPDLGAAERSSR
jgi:DNA-binding GntR family transcriptional regulator